MSRSVQGPPAQSAPQVMLRGRTTPAGVTVGDLYRRVLDDVGDEALRDLLGDDETLAVGADLRQQAGEHLHRVRRRPRRSAGFLAAEQPVGLLDDGQVPQAGGTSQSRPAGHPEVLGQPDQHRSHQERLVAVVTHVLDLQHGVGAEQGAEVELVPALEEPAGGPEPQAGQPHHD
jgi:hypothetical protein